MGNIFKINGSDKKLDKIIELLSRLEELQKESLIQLKIKNKHLELITDEEIIDDNY
jgi:hypothetical protein